MNFEQIYHLLLEGKKLEMPFASAEEAERFRIRMAQYKSVRDRSLLKLGMISKAERQLFSFKIQGELLDAPGSVTATLQFRDKDTLQQFQVKIVSDEGTEA